MYPNINPVSRTGGPKKTNPLVDHQFERTITAAGGGLLGAGGISAGANVEEGFPHGPRDIKLPHNRKAAPIIANLFSMPKMFT